MNRYRLLIPCCLHALVMVAVLAACAAAAGQSSTSAPRPAMIPVHTEAESVADTGSLWPSGVVYYDDSGCIGGGTCPNLAQAISTFNTDFSGVVQWTERTSQATYVVITLSGTGGRGDVNTIGYPPEAGPVALNCNTDCSVTTLLHEMGHMIGLYHEQTRTDRDTYVTMHYENVIKGSWVGNFAINAQNERLLTPYDYASVMQYPAFVDSRNGGPAIETNPPGIPLQGTEGVPGAGNQDYSAGDKEAILRLYGQAPTNVTITSNPVGLQVIVDGQTVTTPQSYDWTLNSIHSLSVPDGVQTLTGDIENSSVSTTFYYTYGRWNDSLVESHTITVSPGDGSAVFPSGSPRIATYSANFVQLVPYTESETPSGEGTVSATPAPQTYSGQSGSFFVAREDETLTATPSSGNNFYEFNATSPYFWLTGGLSANPKEFYVPDTGNPVAVSAEFTSYPVYTVNVAPPSGDNIANVFSDNLTAYIDGAWWHTPKNFSADPAYAYDTVSSWAPGTSHTLNVNFGSPESPYSFNSRFAFSSWNDGGAEQHTIMVPAANTTYTATVTPEYAPATNFSFPPCGGTATISPASPTDDGFYPWGTQLSFQAAPDAGAGWSFGGWTFDLTGNTNPGKFTADDESLIYADFNANTAEGPLSVTSVNPASVAAGSSGVTLTLTGSGFSADSSVTIGGNAATPVDVVSSTEIKVPISASWIASPGTVQVAVENYPTNWNGCAVFGYGNLAVNAAAPFGNEDVAEDATTHSATVSQSDSLLTTGWAADQQDGAPVSQVAILIDGTAVGNATLGGSRPDVANVYHNSAYTNSGWSFTYSAAGLSGGNHTVTAMAYDAEGQSARLNGSRTITVKATAPFGNEDAAQDATTHSATVSQSDSLLVTGWAADAHEGAPVSQVAILIDGTAVGNATLGGSRPDVASHYNNSAYTNSGWSFTYAASGLSGGTHTVTAIAYDNQGLSTQLPGAKTVTVKATAPFGNEDVAQDATTHSATVSQNDSLLVTGWAADAHEGAPVSQVAILIDGTAVGNATLGGSRPDVASHYNNSAYTNSGWSFTYAASGLSGGTHTVTAIAYDNQGLSTQLPGAKTVTVKATAPFGNEDAAQDATTHSATVSQSDSLQVTGWAADAHEGAPVSQVAILIDGTAVGNATLGGSRPDVASHYNNSAYTNSGWSFTYAASGLSGGTHTVTAIAYDNQGLSTQLPGAKTVTVKATAPFGNEDVAQDATTHSATVSQNDSLLVTGWAADAHEGAPVSQVAILIDGTVVGNATLGGSRPDVANYYNNSAYTNSGWSLTYAASGLSAGSHTVTAKAYDNQGLSVQLAGSKTITVTSGGS